MSDHTGHDSVIGEVLASRYRVEALIGEGAMGAVYRARHVKVGRAFAIKVLHPRFSEEERTRKRFAREAEVAGKLHHPNVVSVVDVGDLADGRRYLVMEYAEGVTLLDLINETSPMAASRVISLVRQLCSGLQHAHELGLIHRDFKPDNVIVERDRHGNETPRIVDFGTAILREEAESTSGPRLTTRGLVLGTPHYMSPEHATGSPIDHRIDLFALGVTCYEMMTGHSPYEGDGVDVARANLLLDTPVMSVRVPGLVVDPLLEAFTRKLMMKARDDRPASAAAARDLIDLIDRDRPAAAAALGVALDEPRPAPVVPPSVVTQPIPFEIEPATPAAAATDLAIPWIGGAPAGDTSGPAIPWPVAPSAPGWQPAVRAPSSPPASDAFDAPPTRMRAQPEATEQIVQMAPRTRVWRFVIPAFAALAVLLVMGIALRGRRTHAKTKRVDFASLNTGTAGGEAAPIAMAAVPTAPAAAAAAPAAAPAPSTAPVLDTAPAPSAAPSQAAPSQAAPSQAAPSQASPSQAAPSQAAPSQAAPSQAAPSQAAPSQAAPSQAAPSQAAPSQAAPSQAAPSQAAPSQAATPPARPARAPAAPARPAPTARSARAADPIATRDASPKTSAAGDARPAPPAPPPSNHPITMPVSAAGVAELYASVGRQLKALDEAHGSTATATLWPLYLRIHINDVISDPSKLADASSLLYRIEDQIARRSAAR